MSAFNGSHAAKRSYLAAVHALEAGLLEGAMGDSDLRLRTLPVETGIPRSLLALAEELSAPFSPQQRLAWARRFLEAVSPGAELGQVWMQWMLWALRSPDCGMLHRNMDSLAQPTLEMIERFYQGRLSGRAASHADLARLESIVMLMEQDALNWATVRAFETREFLVARAARAVWDARDGEPGKVSAAVEAMCACQQGSDPHLALAIESLLDLVAHAPVTAAF